MATKLPPLLCELHTHTTWSDGELSPRELCDLYGRAGFDVLAITDHTTPEGCVQEAQLPRLPRGARRRGRARPPPLRPARYPRARTDLRRRRPGASGSRARDRSAPFRRRRGRPRTGFARRTRAWGGACRRPPVLTRRGAVGLARRRRRSRRDPERFGPLVDRFELFNRDTLFAWVAEAALPAVASGDVHGPQHLETLEDAAPVRQGGSRGRRLPALAAACVPGAGQPGAGSASAGGLS